MSVTLNGRVYENADFYGRGYVALFPELIFTDMLAELATWNLAQFESDPIGLTASSLAQEAHGLGIKPTRVFPVLQCITTELGYASGDEIPLAEVMTTAGVPVVTVSVDATNVYVVKGSGAPAVCRRSATVGAVTAIDIAKWQIVVRANK